jgi:uncharacterized protein (TIGR02217 family)
MAFFEQRMNPDLSYGARGGPVYSTSKAYTTSGARIANKNWSMPLHRYDVQHCIKTSSDFEAIRNFFYVVAGAFDGFRFKDWNDHKASIDETTLVNISTNTWQMFKQYPLGNRVFNRRIQKPVSGVRVYRKRATVISDITATDASVELTTGVVTISNNQSDDEYFWAGEFDVPVAFVSDEFMHTIENHNTEEFLIASGPILLEEIRL